MNINRNKMQVTKRDGTKEQFDILKIKQSIAYSCEGVKVNPLELESRIDYFMKNGISTSDIQANIIQHALQLATPSTPEWLTVAGHAFAMDELHAFKVKGRGFADLVKHNCNKGLYTKDLLKFYSTDDLLVLEGIIDYDRDLAHSYASLLTGKKKYQNKNELNQHMHMVNAMRFGQFEGIDSRLEAVKQMYDVLSKREFSLATPFMLNLRSGGNTASCFILAIEDDLSSIFDNVKRVAEISKNGGGLGIFLGYLRAKGSSVGGNDNAAGTVVQWVKILNDTLVAVNQSFTGDTLIDTVSGQVPISDIVAGDQVKTHDGSYKQVLGVKSRQNDTPIVELVTERGSVNVTTGHPVLVVDGGEYRGDKSRIINDLKSDKIKPYWVDASQLTSSHFVVKC
jgi:ribonucleoside-diphosphate reductase alpha chain